MKSSKNDLQKRGYAYTEDIEKLKEFSQSDLVNLLHSNNAVTRTSAAYNLSATKEVVAKELLKQLCSEKCLYTKIAICQCLEKGNIDTAKQMINYLGKIGTNQHKQLPPIVSAKKSYPLPRDIIARSLGRMNVSVFPLLLNVLKSNDILSISEALDAIGFMAFYHQELVTEINAKVIYETINNYDNNSLIIWKCILCLSAFPLDKSIVVLKHFAIQDNILGKEARRSLMIINKKL